MSRKWAIGAVAALVVAVAVVLVLRGGGDSAGQAASATEPAELEKGQGRDGGKGDSKTGEDSGGKGTKGGRKDDGKGRGPEPTKEELATSRRIQKRVAVNTVAGQNVLKVFGLAGSAKIRDEGRVVVVLVARKSACDAVPGDEERIRRFLLDAEPSIREVVVEVAGTGQSLAAYVAANCEQPEFPGGPGATAFEETGEGFVTEKLTVRGPRFAIDYRADGASLFVFVLKGGDVVDPAIAQQGRGSGTQKYKGKGAYTLEIRGSGYWKVRVRDGA